MDDTQPQFGERLPGPSLGSGTTSGTRCPHCGQSFAPEARFCPFDGEVLEPARSCRPTGDPLLDQVVDGKYRVEAVIGQGGMGVVYRVRHVVLGKPFALKALRLDLVGDTEIGVRFIEEARTTTRLSHPGIVEVSDFGTLPTSQAYFVMELLEGRTLRDLMRSRGAFSSARALRLTRQIADALKAAHDRGIVHRDLKPDNVYVMAGDAVKIVDFGLARAIDAGRVTREGIVFGTPHYMSPEQACGEATDHRSDIYALGVVFYEMLTGTVPFDADTYVGVVHQHVHAEPIPPSRRLGDAAQLAPIEPMVLRCLAKQPADRYASLDELIAELDRALAAPGSEGLGTSSREAFAIPLRRGRRVYLVGLALLASLGLAWMIAKGSRDPAPEGAATDTLRASAPPSVPVRVVKANIPEPPPAAAEPDAQPDPEVAPRVAPAAPEAPPPSRRAPVETEPAPPLVEPRPRPLSPAAGDIVDPWGR